VVLLHAQQEEALGCAFDLPDLMKPPVLEAWVAERSGRVVGGFFCEAVVDTVFFGRNPEVSASARRLAPSVIAGLAVRGFRSAQIQVPRWIGQEAETIRRELQRVGFDPTDDFHHLVFDLRPLAHLASRNGRG
jgi:hypothetical protein